MEGCLKMIKNVHRMEIWMADFKDNGNKSVVKGKHPCIIISGWKSNIKKSGIVNVIPITSNLTKYLNVHIDLHGYSLKGQSKALCNQVCSIDKDLLEFKIGQIDDIYTQLEIEKAILTQFQMNNQRLEIEDNKQFEDYFINTMKGNNNIKIYNDLKDKIYELTSKELYEDCIISCNKLIELILDSKIVNKMEFLWHGYYHRAMAYSKMNHNDLALEDARMSLTFIDNIRSGISNKYSYSMWMVAYCYENIGDIEAALKVYSQISLYYKSQGRFGMRAAIIFNIAKLEKNINRMKSLTKIMENANFIEYETNKTREYLLQQMKEELRSDVIN